MSWYWAAVARASSYFPVHQFAADLTGQAAGKANQALGMLRQIILADARFAVEAMQRGLGGNPHQVTVPFFVFRQNQQMVVLILFRGGAMVLLGTDVKLASQDGLDAPGGCGLKKMHRAVNVAVVGNGHSLLSDTVDVRHQFFDIAGAVQERIISVEM